jgi:hypothetical protein
LPINETLADPRLEYPHANSIVIDMKPRGAGIHLCELLDAWGYSWKSWTPILLRISVLIWRDDRRRHNKWDFIVPVECEEVYSTVYAQGSVRKGKLTGRWTPPPVAATNGPLLWPHALRYFIECIRRDSPDVVSYPRAVPAAYPSTLV